MFELYWAEPAKESFESLRLEASKQKQYKAVKNALKKLAADPSYPGLRSHEFFSIKGPNGERVFESYAENKTPSAYRVFWYYGSGRGIITIFMIAAHP